MLRHIYMPSETSQALNSTVLYKKYKKKKEKVKIIKDCWHSKYVHRKKWAIEVRDEKYPGGRFSKKRTKKKTHSILQKVSAYPSQTALGSYIET